MDKIYQPVVLYILESDSTKTFYASHVRLKYSLDHENENVHIHRLTIKYIGKITANFSVPT